MRTNVKLNNGFILYKRNIMITVQKKIHYFLFSIKKIIFDTYLSVCIPTHIYNLWYSIAVSMYTNDMRLRNKWYIIEFHKTKFMLLLIFIVNY